MTSEPDSKPGRRPPTIELKATEVEQPDAAAQPGAGDAADASSPESSGPQQPGAATGRLKSYTVGALLGAAAIVAIIAVLRLSGLMPSRQAAAPAPAATPETSVALPSTPNNEAAIEARLDKLERAVKAQQTEPGQNKRAAAAEAQSKALADAVATLNRRVDEIAVTSQSAAKTAAAAQAAADAAKTASEKASQSASQAANDAAKKAASEAAGQAASQAATQVASQTGVQKSDFEAVTKRIATVENAVKALSENAAHPAEGANDQAARLTIATEALRATVERGAPYQPELTAVQALGVAPDAIAPLKHFAATGVPTTAALAHELEALTPNLRRAAETPSGGSTFLDRLEAHARNLVQITPVDAPPGNEPAAVIARIEIDAARADIASALNDIAALPQAAKPLAADWVDRAKAREAAIAASRKIAAAALVDLSKPASQ